MTITDKAKEIFLFIRNMPDEQAIDYLRVKLTEVHIAGERSGVEQVFQTINRQQQAAE